MTDTNNTSNNSDTNNISSEKNLEEYAKRLATLDQILAPGSRRFITLNERAKLHVERAKLRELLGVQPGDEANLPKDR